MSRVTVNNVPASAEKKHPVFAELEDVAEKIRARAFQLFQHRGFDDGRAIDDWLTAERQVCWPAAELDERDNEFLVEIALAGFEPEDIEVTATPDEIVVRASHEESRKAKGDKPVWSEFRSNHVLRRVEMPSAIDADKVKAEYRRGLLKIEAHKASAGKADPASRKRGSTARKKGKVRVNTGD